MDPLEARIEIVAKPRGKRPTSIDLLSGGEKTLTAIALLFAIYLVKPSPFCILDEVDAPLDDANVDRFTRILRKFSVNTQFIVVTHNKRTMEAANAMYGVTMEEEGVSKLVTVRFNQNSQIAAGFGGVSMSRTYRLFLDFDGTMTAEDVGNRFFDRFGGPVCTELVRRYRAEEISARACFEQEMAAVGALDPAAFTSFLAQQELDPGARELIESCTRMDVEVTILSDGLDAYIRPLLERHGRGRACGASPIISGLAGRGDAHDVRSVVVPACAMRNATAAVAANGISCSAVPGMAMC